MDRSPLPAASSDFLADVLAWLESHLHEPLTLERIAAQAGLSPYYFSRLFTARMGRSVMAHVRGRRLLVSARRLIDEADLKIVDLALDSGFDSPEAYTRAFKRVFGVAPARFRQGCALTPIEGHYPMSLPAPIQANVVLLPERVALAAFTVAGLSRRFDEASKSAIPQLWSQLIGRLPFEGQIESWNTYGVVWSADRDEGSFSYMAGVAVQPGARLPAGFASLPIPAASYAVFRITLNGGPLHPQIKAAMAVVWGQLIPASGLRVGDSPDFEIYDGRSALDQPGAVIDFHVPIEN